MPDTHHIHSPSKLDALSCCPCYESEPGGSDAAARGTRQHEYLQALLTDTPCECISELEQEELEQVEWAARWVTENTSADHRLVEEHLVVEDDGFNVLTEGTADILEPPVDATDAALVIDYKSGERRSYRAQLAAYGLGAMQRFGCRAAIVVILYGRFRRAEKYHVTYDEAMAAITDIIAKVTAPNPAPQACDYCAWCAHAATCPSLAPAVTALARWTAPDAPVVQVTDITDPRALAELLAVADYAEAQIEAIRKHARRLAITDGVPIHGYAVRERRGSWEVNDLQGLYAESGLTAQEFMNACKVNTGDFITALVLTKKATTKAEATKLANAMFEKFGERKASTKYLQKEK